MAGSLWIIRRMIIRKLYKNKSGRFILKRPDSRIYEKGIT